MPDRALVVDANILVRAVLGKRAREVIETYAGEASFFVPESAYDEAKGRNQILGHHDVRNVTANSAYAASPR